MNRTGLPNSTFDRTVRSHSLAAAGQRGRWASLGVSQTRNVTASKQALFLAALLISGVCAAQLGQISEGTYISPLNNFTVPIPRGIGTRVQDEGGPNGGMVAFHDDFGNFKSIFYLRLSPEATQTQIDPEKQRANLQRFLSNFAMPNLFRRASPRANVLTEEHITVGESSAYFAIVDLPEGSTMYDAKANKRFDTWRGVLVFVNDAFIYMLSSGENPSVLELKKPKTLEQLKESEKDTLVSFKSVIAFKP